MTGLNILKEDSSESVDSVDYSGEGGPIELLEKGPAKYCKKEQKVCKLDLQSAGSSPNLTYTKLRASAKFLRYLGLGWTLGTPH